MDERLLVDDREVMITSHLEVRCDGGGGTLGHPSEYMTLAKGGEAVCAYCSRHYVHEGSAEAEALRARGKSFVA